MTDIKTVAPALSELRVEFGENSITVKRASNLLFAQRVG